MIVAVLALAVVSLLTKNESGFEKGFAISRP